MSEFRILDTNLLWDTAYTLTTSSANTEFPATNLQHHFRTRPWRSSGNFVIDATNNKLDFDEGGGELTATISSDTYTPAEIATEIKTQLDSAGGDTYTVSYASGTGKFTIATDGDPLSLLWDSGTNTLVSVGASIGFSLAADDTSALTYTSDTVALHTEEWVKYDFGATTDFDSVAYLFDAVDGKTLSGSAVVKFQAHASDAWSSPTVDETLSFDSTYGLYTHFFASTQQYRWVRFQIVDRANPNLYVEAPVLIVSNATQLTQVPERGFTNTVIDNSKTTITPYGHSYGDTYPKQRLLSFLYAALPKADAETLYTIYNTLGRTTPFAVALDATASLFDKDRFFLYGYFAKELVLTHSFGQYFDTGFDVVEAF